MARKARTATAKKAAAVKKTAPVVTEEIVKETVEVKESVEEAAVEVKEAEVEAAVEVKEAEAEETAAEVKETEAEAAAEEKKPAAKKPAAKKTTTKKALKTNLVVQAAGKEVSMDEAIARVKSAWKASGHKIGDLKEITVYVKPEEDSIYYVVNGDVTGRVEF